MGNNPVFLLRQDIRRRASMGPSWSIRTGWILELIQTKEGVYNSREPHPFRYSLLTNWLAASKLVMRILGPSHW